MKPGSRTPKVVLNTIRRSGLARASMALGDKFNLVFVFASRSFKAGFSASFHFSDSLSFLPALRTSSQS